jgi:hypothetical protein
VRTGLATALVALGCTTARAEPVAVRGFVEAALGVAIPVGDAGYRRFASPTFAPSLRGGVELWVSRRWAVAPELQLDGMVVNTNDDTYRPLTFDGAPAYDVDTPFSRWRALAGARVVVDFGFGAAVARLLVGVDHLTGSEQATRLAWVSEADIPPQRFDFSSTGFTVQPGIGVQLRFARYGIAGLSLELPVAFQQFNREDAAHLRSFTTVDLDVLATIGYRGG